MGSSPESPPSASPEFLAVFRTHADARGEMPFARFMDLALYHPEVGYYRRKRQRVGRGPGTDFFTSSTSGPLFGELVSAACAKLLRATGRDPAAHTFVEIGAEPFDSAKGGPGEYGVMAGVKHPFAAVRTIRVDERLDTLTGKCVVFSNELFDAQPFTRTVSHHGRWHHVGVRLEKDRLVETLLPAKEAAFAAPEADGYRFDWPASAALLAGEIVQQEWRGLFVAIDYGKTFIELSEKTPEGTGRAYYQHTQSNDLLARPGEQDITCHICWDWMIDTLGQNGFAEPKLEFQESFFVRHAGEFIAAASVADAATFSPRKLALQQLLHPAHLGQKFQVLHAVR